MSNRRRREKHRRFLLNREKKIARLKKTRKNKRYIPRSDSDSSRFKPNKRISRNRGQPVELILPADFSTASNLVGCLEALESFRDAVYRRKVREVRLDHRPIVEIDPAASLMLIAEIMRAVQCAPKCKLSCYLPQNSIVAEVLEKLDYWIIFGLRRNHSSETNEQYVMRMTDRRTIPVMAKNIILGFKDCCTLSDSQNKVLYKGLIECMDNVMFHAYPGKSKTHRIWLLNQWWMLAYKNLTAKEVTLCFYDQGVGIPQTIRTRWKDKLNPLRSDEDIIAEAVCEGKYSRTKEETRGRGLPKLLEVVNGNEFSGQLRIITGTSSCCFRSNADVDKGRLNKAIEGTLIIWKLSTNHEN